MTSVVLQTETESDNAGQDAWAVAFLDRLAAQDAHFALKDGKISANAPPGVITSAVRAEIETNRDRLIAHLAAVAAAQQNAFPLSSAQERLWFLDRMNPGNPQHNIGGALRIRGGWDASGAAAAVERLIARHPLLRARFGDVSGEPRVELLDRSRTELKVVDLSDRPLADAEAQAAGLAHGLLSQPFDLGEGRLASFLVVKEAADQHLVAIAAHQIAADKWSLALLLRELAALAQGGEPAPVALNYADYSAREAAWLQSGAVEAQLGFWAGALQGAPALLELPTDHARPAESSFRGRRWTGRLDADLLAKVTALAHARDTTPFTVLLATWQMLMHRYAGQKDVVVGTTVSNRDDAGFDNVVGCFINTVALRATFDGDPSVGSVLDQVKASAASALANQKVPFDRVIGKIQAPRRLDHAPIYQVMFALQPAAPSSDAGGLAIEAVDMGTVGAPVDLTVEATLTPDAVLLGYEYATDLFEERTIAALHERYVRFLQSVCADPAGLVRDLPLLSDRERSEAMDRARGPRIADEPACIHRLFEASAKARPDAVAVRFGDTSITYGELNDRADRLAARLGRQGVKRGDVVGVLLERGPAIAEALLAVLKAGAAYLPMDPTHPPARLQHMLDQSKSACVVTTGDLAARVEGGTPTLILDHADADAATAFTPVDVSPDDLAYVIYTSGSTGKPKGVEIEHRHFVAFLRAMAIAPGLNADDVMLAVTTIAFDIAGLEFWGPLTCGGCVIIAPASVQSDGAALAGLIAQHGVTVLQATPATWRLLLATGWQGAPRLKALCGGEAMPRELAADLIGRVGELWNMYGPTETTVWSSAGRITDAAQISIGRPIANTDIFVLDEAGGLVPPGVAGELCIGGAGVARGYRFAPDLTADRFVERELGGVMQRVYRTGDVGRYLPDDRLECLGRRDSQIKLRGYRIELDEIETTLRGHEAMRDAVVAAVERSPGDLRLVAYVVFQPFEEPTVSELRAFAREQLPDYMVPSLFVTLDALPLTPNGKIDRKALPEPFAIGRVAQSREPPANDAEREMAAIWQELLRLDTIGRDDNFFELGGHSLLSLRVAAATQRRMGRRLEPRTLFFQTLRQVVAGLEPIERQEAN